MLRSPASGKNATGARLADVIGAGGDCRMPSRRRRIGVNHTSSFRMLPMSFDPNSYPQAAMARVRNGWRSHAGGVLPKAARIRGHFPATVILK